jgi:hypothetical protein
MSNKSNDRRENCNHSSNHSRQPKLDARARDVGTYDSRVSRTMTGDLLSEDHGFLDDIVAVKWELVR